MKKIHENVFLCLHVNLNIKAQKHVCLFLCKFSIYCLLLPPHYIIMVEGLLRLLDKNCINIIYHRSHTSLFLDSTQRSESSRVLKTGL